MLTLPCPLIFINENPDYLWCPDKQMAQITGAVSRFNGPAHQGRWLYTQPIPHLSSPPSTPNPFCSALTGLRHEGQCVMLSVWRTVHTSLTHWPMELGRHWGTAGNQRSNGADLPHKSLSPVVFISDKVKSLFWLNATQILTTITVIPP